MCPSTFSAPDQIPPRSAYARMGWSYIADPAAQTFGAVKPQMLKGYGYAKEKYIKKKL